MSEGNTEWSLASKNSMLIFNSLEKENCLTFTITKKGGEKRRKLPYKPIKLLIDNLINSLITSLTSRNKLNSNSKRQRQTATNSKRQLVFCILWLLPKRLLRWSLCQIQDVLLSLQARLCQQQCQCSETCDSKFSVKLPLK